MWSRTAVITNSLLRRSGLADQSGATAMEYALIGTGIGVAIIAALFSIGDEIVRLFELVQTTLDGATN
ncbi:MAG: Flp family type IVb pilin [Rhodospirillaceae bacterium]|jgi:Flp pilus assembly pilin Flp|nr:Flp family type IVb pilin [Rhodospirillaceae bacterium]MBT4490873.1 Flp family type IVb pilin [Rhodospirillaceae bacterium]MBT5193026.1 Flp family type IVb pilin [Rhodospirillaceae bacterium]MBT5895384.1 Flp family type IVb pilin [Rhodospirillaceae bacterium]MBT6429159.1 Flp family type IVb pilin [Rhodospirillaceae bacterium]